MEDRLKNQPDGRFFNHKFVLKRFQRCPNLQAVGSMRIREKRIHAQYEFKVAAGAKLPPSVFL